MSGLTEWIDEKEFASWIIAGIQNANTEFENSTRGYWISDSGVEALVQVRVYDEVNSHLKHRNLAVAIEPHFSYMFGDHPELGHRIDNIKNKKPDILIWSENWKPRSGFFCLGEIKRKWTKTDLNKDLSKCISYLFDSRAVILCFFGCMIAFDSKSSRLKDIERAKIKFDKDVKEIFAGKVAEYSEGKGSSRRLEVKCHFGDQISPNRKIAWNEHVDEENYDRWIGAPAVVLIYQKGAFP